MSGGRTQHFDTSPSSPVLAGLRKAVDHLNAGRHEEAEQQARQVLTLQPDDGSALNVIGVVALQRGDFDNAVTLFRRALRVQPANPFIHFNLAEAHRRSRAYGNAISHYEKAVQLKPDLAEAHAHKGEALRAKGRLVDAASAYRKGLDLQPGLASALNGLGRLLQSTGALVEAAHHYETAMATELVGDPSAIAALYANTGLMRLQRGAAIEGFTALTEAVQRAPESAEFWRLLAQSLRHTKIVPSTRVFRDILLALLQRPDVDPSALATAAVVLLKSEPMIAERLEEARDAAESEAAADTADPALQALILDPLFGALLVAAPIPDVEIELALTSLRRTLVLAAVQGDFGPHRAIGLGFIVSLAQQCFLNEYVYFQESDEDRALMSLRQRLLEFSFDDAEDWLTLATAACFLPVGHLALAESALAAPPALVGPLLRQQLEEPAQEAAILADFKARTETAEPSGEMRGEAGEAPFPRWTRAFIGSPKPFREVVRAILPHLGVQEAPSVRAPRIMILGCRTGLPILGALGAYEGASILAVDANSKNLAYAKRKLIELNVQGVELLRADVSDLIELGPEFDLVDAPFAFYDSGETEEVLASLASTLKPGALVRFKLYSATARQAVSHVHAIIALSKTGVALPELRGLRRDLMLNPIASEMDVIKSPASDFWASSPCRELLFRPDERRFDLPEIGDLLGRLRLDFLGLELGYALDWARFAAEHPGPDAHVDLEAWRQFESDHPEVFGGGYSIWARKRHGRR